MRNIIAAAVVIVAAVAGLGFTLNAIGERDVEASSPRCGDTVVKGDGNRVNAPCTINVYRTDLPPRPSEATPRPTPPPKPTPGEVKPLPLMDEKGVPYNGFKPRRTVHILRAFANSDDGERMELERRPFTFKSVPVTVLDDGKTRVFRAGSVAGEIWVFLNPPYNPGEVVLLACPAGAAHYRGDSFAEIPSVELKGCEENITTP